LIKFLLVWGHYKIKFLILKESRDL